MGYAKYPLFPAKISAVVADLNTKKQYIEENNDKFNIPATEIALIKAQVDEVNRAYVEARDKDMRSKFNISTRNWAIITAKKTMRRIIDYYIAGKPNTATIDYEGLHIAQPNYRHVHSLPRYSPKVIRIVSHELDIIATIIDSNTGKRTKPEGIQYIEVYYQFDGEYPTDANTMPEHKLFTSSPIRLKFTPHDEYKFVYFACRWVGTRGDYGIWSEIHKKIIIR
jgi:hypothetical protein